MAYERGRLAAVSRPLPVPARLRLVLVALCAWRSGVALACAVGGDQCIWLPGRVPRPSVVQCRHCDDCHVTRAGGVATTGACCRDDERAIRGRLIVVFHNLATRAGWVSTYSVTAVILRCAIWGQCIQIGCLTGVDRVALLPNTPSQSCSSGWDRRHPGGSRPEWMVSQLSGRWGRSTPVFVHACVLCG